MTDTVFRHGHFVWRELMTTDIDKAKAFYAGLFGWTLTDMPMPSGTYTIIHNGEAQIGGMMGVPPGAPAMSYWNSYVSVANVDEVVARTVAAGGRVLMPPIDVEGVGRFALLMDPTGGAFSVLRQSGGDGALPMPAPGAFCWESLNESARNAAAPFYEKVLGWKHSTENGNLFFAGDRMIGDVGSAPPGMPTHWLTHVVVRKLEDARATVEKLGGKVMMAEVPVPQFGRLAVVSDPTGAYLSLFEPAPR